MVSAAAQTPLPDLATAVQAALADAKRATGQAAKVVKKEEVTWPDASLGCPEKDMMYGQALTPGYRIRLQAGSRTLDYHASAQGTIVQCPRSRAKPPLPRDRQ